MYPGVELRLLRYVVAVAEELHFSRAAEELHVAQPSLSKEIRDLEDEIGIRLFDRTKRDVHLTQAGQAFVIEAKEALVHSQRAVHAAKATVQPDRFTLGHSPDINPRLLASVRAIPAQLWKLTFRSVFTMEQLQLIRAGELDAGVVILPIPGDSLTIEPILSEPLIAALPEQHELCGKRALRLRDLRDVPLITIPKSLHPYFYDCMYSICIQERFKPTIAHEAMSFPEAMSSGNRWSRRCIHARMLRTLQVSGRRVHRKIEGQPLAVESAIVFRKGARSAVLPAIIAPRKLRSGLRRFWHFGAKPRIDGNDRLS